MLGSTFPAPCMTVLSPVHFVVFSQSFIEPLVLDQVARQARMLQKQVLMTRKWVADHNGLFFLKKEGVAPNPFLKEPEIIDTEGRQYVKRNPAMVTRELSEYVSHQGLFNLH